MRIAITGASGNAGTALLLRLGATGEHELVGISRRPPPAAPPYSWCEWVRCDVGAPGAEKQLQQAFTGADAVVHLAWQLQPQRDREALRRTNQGGTAAVVAAALAAGVGHLVHQSSVGTYAPGHGRLVDEDWPTTGIRSSMYSVDKAAAERIVAQAEGRTTVTRVRPALIFQDAAASEIARYFLGPLVPPAAVRPQLMRLAPLSDRLAFQAVHADDVAAAIDVLLQQRAGGAFNVAAPPLIDRQVLRETFGGVGPALPPRVLRAAASATWRLRLQPTEPGWLDLAAHVPTMRTDRLRELGWEPKRDAADVLQRFVAAMGRGAGRPGPLLYRAHGRQTGPTTQH